MVAQEKDDRYIPVVAGTNNVPNLQALNEVIKQIWQAIHALEGRVGEVTILSDVVIDGTITADDFITA